MADKSKLTWEQKISNNRWSFFVFALIFLAMAYGFASWAIDNGSLWQYALAIISLLWAIKEIKYGIHGLIRK